MDTANYDRGRTYWNGHSKVIIPKSTSATNADRYYIGNTSTPNLYGRMSSFDINGSPVSLHGYWHYTTVYMYANQMRAQSNYSSSRVDYNATHEIGHTLKMNHSPSKAIYSVMTQGFVTIPPSLTQYDRGEIDAKW